MKNVLKSGIVLFICVLILIGSVVMAETVNENFWWQVIGMAIVTFSVGRYYFGQFKTYKEESQK